MKKRRGAAEVEVRMEVGEEVEEEEGMRREEVGSRWFWRSRRFVSIIKNDSSIGLVGSLG